MSSINSNILIIEDSPTQRAILSNLVTELGFKPICPVFFDEGIIDQINKHSIKIVLLDLILLDNDGTPIADGFQICEDIKSQCPSVKIIVISAESDSAAQDFAAAQGADTFIGKPFKIDELEFKIRSLGIEIHK